MKNYKWFALLAYYFIIIQADIDKTPKRQIEAPERGIVAVRTSNDEVFLSWRLLGTDPPGTGFNLYRSGEKLNRKPITRSTNFTDKTYVDAVPSVNFRIYRDGDLQDELLDRSFIDDWDYINHKPVRLLDASQFGGSSINGSKATPVVSADILGDWREEVIFRGSDDASLLLFTTTIPTDQRLFTLMHDPVYRLGVAWQNTVYNQPPHLRYYIGDGIMEAKKK